MFSHYLTELIQKGLVCVVFLSFKLMVNIYFVQFPSHYRL